MKWVISVVPDRQYGCFVSLKSKLRPPGPGLSASGAPSAKEYLPGGVPYAVPARRRVDVSCDLCCLDSLATPDTGVGLWSISVWGHFSARKFTVAD